MHISDYDEWINTETGTLHRGRCVTATHMLDGTTKMTYRVGETLAGRPIIEHVAQNHDSHIVPVGIGVGYTRTCGRCKPLGVVGAG